MAICSNNLMRPYRSTLDGVKNMDTFPAVPQSDSFQEDLASKVHAINFNRRAKKTLKKPKNKKDSIWIYIVQSIA